MRLLRPLLPPPLQHESGPQKVLKKAGLWKDGKVQGYQFSTTRRNARNTSLMLHYSTRKSQARYYSSASSKMGMSTTVTPMRSVSYDCSKYRAIVTFFRSGTISTKRLASISVIIARSCLMRCSSQYPGYAPAILCFLGGIYHVRKPPVGMTQPLYNTGGLVEAGMVRCLVMEPSSDQANDLNAAHAWNL